MLDRLVQVLDRGLRLLDRRVDLFHRRLDVLHGRRVLQHGFFRLLYRGRDLQHRRREVQHGRRELLDGGSGLQATRPSPLSGTAPADGGPIERWPAALTTGERLGLLAALPTWQSATGPNAPNGSRPSPSDLPIGFLKAESYLEDVVGSADTAEVVLSLARLPAPAWAYPDWIDDDPGQQRGLIRAAAATCRRRLAASLEDRAGDRLAVGRVSAALARSLVEELEVLLFRPLTLERRIAILEGREADRASADLHDDLGDPAARREFFGHYPGVLRQLHLRCERWLAANSETLLRLEADREAIEATFGIAADDRLVAAHATSGDPHCGGRRVTSLRFETGAKLIYKPRPLGSTKLFQELLEAMNQASLPLAHRTVAVLDCGGYGWMEHVREGACRGERAVARYFCRAGSLLAALHLLGGRDCHFENVIASGEHPVAVDLETLLAPEWRRGDGSATARAAAERDASVLAVGMLPSIDGSELGALAAAPGQTTTLATTALVDAGTPEARVERVAWRLGDVASLPLLGRARRPAAGFAAEIGAGYVQGYEALRRLRPTLLTAEGLLDRLAAQEVRVVLRPTAHYGELLLDATHPFALNDALQADRALASLWPDAPDDIRLAAAPAELRQLRAADVPYFSFQGRSRTLGQIGPSVARAKFGRSGRDAAAGRLRRMGAACLARQSGLIRAAFAPPTAQLDRIIGRSGAVRAAAAIGARLVSEAVTTTIAASWLHLTAADGDRGPSLNPVGAGIYDGLLGIALFLGRLHVATGQRRFANLARKALREVRDRMGVESPLGVFDGLGGIVYALAHLAPVFGDDDLLDEAERAADRVCDGLGAPAGPGDLIAGSAGLALAALALEAVRPSAAGDRLLVATGTHLRFLIESGKDHCDRAALPFTRGAAHGWSGVLLASARLHAARPDLMPHTVVETAIRIDAEMTAGCRWTDPWDEIHEGQATWCHGAPGIALCRMAAARVFTSDTLEAAARDAIDAVERATTDRLPDPGLCHGAMGVLQTTLAASAWSGGGAPVARAMLPDETAGAPHTFRPGLMTGLAGVGYGLLRLGDPTVPDVLTLDPPTPSAR